VRCCARRSRARGECGTLSALSTELPGGGLPGWIRTNDLSLGRRSNRALQRRIRLAHGPANASRSPNGHVLMVLLLSLGDSRGLPGKWRTRFGADAPVVVGERSNRAPAAQAVGAARLFRRGAGAHGRIRTSTVRIRNPAHYPVVLRARCPLRHASDSRQLVETAGNAPAATILQGSSAPLCCPRRWPGTLERVLRFGSWPIASS
jgi:hypothetical protein